MITTHIQQDEETGQWVIAGRRIVYAASGGTLEEAKRNFLRGLGMTIKLNSHEDGQLMDRYVRWPEME